MLRRPYGNLGSFDVSVFIYLLTLWLHKTLVQEILFLVLQEQVLSMAFLDSLVHF